MGECVQVWRRLQLARLMQDRRLHLSRGGLENYECSWRLPYFALQLELGYPYTANILASLSEHRRHQTSHRTLHLSNWIHPFSWAVRSTAELEVYHGTFQEFFPPRGNALYLSYKTL